MSVPQAPVLLLSALGLLTVAYFRWRNRPLKDIRGPPSPSFLLGNTHEILNQYEVGDCDFPWIEEYGQVFRVSGCCGEHRLYLADPKALQYVLHTSGYEYVKARQADYVTELFLGYGLATAKNGDAHKRQRKVMNPAFSSAQIKSFLPLFQKSASRLTAKWLDELLPLSGGEINVSKGLGQLTLDALGDAAFAYRFGALDNEETDLTKALKNLFVDSVMNPTLLDTLFKASWEYLPAKLVKYYISHAPTREYARFKRFRAISFETASSLVNKGSDANQTSNDILSILVRSNSAEDVSRRLNDEEVLAQMATFILAGQETSASTLTWLLYELARNPNDQRRLRDEIASARERTGESAFSFADYENMPFLSACVKEVLRLHPIAPLLQRVASRDDVIPLDKPIQTRSGKMIREIPIRKGQAISITIAGYNRLSSVWGDDSHQWNPSRFLDINSKSEQNITLGVYANLMSFSAGLRACIGWRFAVEEMNCVIVELIENFSFEPSKSNVEIRRAFAGLMMPIAKDKPYEGVQMPLHITSLRPTL